MVIMKIFGAQARHELQKVPGNPLLQILESPMRGAPYWGAWKILALGVNYEQGVNTFSSGQLIIS